MKHPKILFFLAGLSILGSCNKNLAPTASPYAEGQTQQFVTYPIQNDQVKEPESNFEPTTISTSNKKRSGAVVTDFTFSELEKTHPSKSEYDPFGADGVLRVEVGEKARYSYPLDGKLLSPYGPRGSSWHSGADLKGEKGDPIYALTDGVVRISSNYGAYGNIIVIRHYNGLESCYAHNEKNLVRVGDKVRAGEKIATCGATGNASGTHCHFEIRVIGATIDPALVLDYEAGYVHEGVLVVRSVGGGKVSASIEKSGAEEPVYQEIQPAVTTTEYHTVVRGNTLSSIARQYGTTVAELCRLNNITTKTVLQINRKLKVR
ncbi:MAG: peptidoglycan DD-metalloendopeptidase family protein [Rikenellaceae bacterium]